MKTQEGLYFKLDFFMPLCNMYSFSIKHSFLVLNMKRIVESYSFQEEDFLSSNYILITVFVYL